MYILWKQEIVIAYYINIKYLCNVLSRSHPIRRIMHFERPSVTYGLVTWKQESPAVADKPARRLRKVCTIYVRAVGW